MSENQEGNTARCSRCKEVKPVSEFHKRVNRECGIASHCRACHSKHYYKADLWRERRYQREYGITLAQYDEMFAKQGGVCALCGGESNGRGRLAVDHDHTTGVARGLLCFTCNGTLGFVEIIGLERLREYLMLALPKPYEPQPEIIKIDNGHWQVRMTDGDIISNHSDRQGAQRTIERMAKAQPYAAPRLTRLFDHTQLTTPA